MEIIRKLSVFDDSRTLEFLFDHAFMEGDLAFAEVAIWSLSQTRNALAAKFLARSYEGCPETLKPYVVTAIARLGDRSIAPRLAEDLEEQATGNRFKLVESLILALGELKYEPALAVIERFLINTENSRHRMSALISVGKLSRSTAVLDS